MANNLLGKMLLSEIILKPKLCHAQQNLIVFEEILDKEMEQSHIALFNETF